MVGRRRVGKDDARMHAIGTVDELNALLGIFMAEPVEQSLSEGVAHIQHQLFRVGADLATPMEQQSDTRITDKHTHELEDWIAKIEPTLPPLTQFILPDGSRSGALLHHARTVCRRAERWIVAIHSQEEVNMHILTYLNRLSDLLFLLARSENLRQNSEETPVTYE